MKWLTSTDELNALIADKRVLRVEEREVFNTTFNCMWTMTGLVLDDGSFIGISTDEDPEFLLFEEGK